MAATGIPLADGVQATAGLIQTGIGLINQEKTKREAQRLAATRPQYQISPLTGQGLSLAESDLSNGMSNAASRAYSDQDNGQFSSAIGSTLKAGGNVNSIGAIYGSNQDGRLRLAQMQDNLRLNQINNYVKASQGMQDAQQTQWQVNKFGPWQDAAQANAAARQAASQQVSQGLNSFGAGVANAGQAVQEKNNFTLPTFPNNNSNGSAGYSTGIPVNNSIPNLYPSNSLTPMNRYPTFNS
ncbi:MAG: hypothetical protein ABI091_26725 [Ferruginibacter sp.]